MKIAFYRKDGAFATKYEHLSNPKFIGKDLIFDQVTFGCLDSNYVLLGDEVDPPDSFDDALLLDQKNTVAVEKSKQELDEEKDKRISNLEDALLAVLDLIP